MFRPAVPWLLVALALFVAGVAMYVLADGALETLSLAFFGVAGVVAASAVFYAVGLSEDRERERESRRRGKR